MVDHSLPEKNKSRSPWCDDYVRTRAAAGPKTGADGVADMSFRLRAARSAGRFPLRHPWPKRCMPDAEAERYSRSMKRSIPERDISAQEAAIIDWLLDHAATRV
jgi:hypothetical protein